MIYFINAETKEHRVYKSGDLVDSRIWKIVEADIDGWIEWEGESDSSPVPCATLCRIKLSDGCELETMAPEEWSWSRGGDQHIIAYRPILSEPEADDTVTQMLCLRNDELQAEKDALAAQLHQAEEKIDSLGRQANALHRIASTLDLWSQAGTNVSIDAVAEAAAKRVEELVSTAALADTFPCRRE